jgi:protein-S-isoprenylcysteine O-methyltransferase Ste14
VQARLSVLAFAAMVAGIAGAYYAHTLFTRAPLAVAVQVAAVALMVWARVTFGRRSFHAAASPTSGGIVNTGPYRYIRHPIYTAAIAFVLPGALLAHAPLALASAALVIAGAVVRMLCEESMLVARYPEYAQYARATSRVIPGVF